ncbi:hypothetical protein C6Y58_10575 [Stutzerimonas stutzeri]|uniref:Uncharacterized protein n=1 Tax=Pseudomonas songnenensis TaxID=1176259 RepID=A0ABX9UV16_9PSED|nr:hypothetical protein C6Y58_10575 [Stutzerimonas stutzeri]RMH97100.1 hypothetical protein EA798_11940 [Pseudomonas songnenensis]
MHGLLLTVGSGWKLECTDSANAGTAGSVARGALIILLFVCRPAPIRAAWNHSARPISLLCPDL